MIVTILNVHDNLECSLDTLDSIMTYVGENVIILVDGLSWNKWSSVATPACKLKGFPHGLPKSPYRNVALGMNEAFDLWGDKATWFLYTEYDALFSSERFKHNLKMAEEKKVWMLGSNGRVDKESLPLIQSMVGGPFKSSYYLLGCCQFFHIDFMKKLAEINFFERFLNLTNNFKDGFFPLYTGYDLSEHLYPTLCRFFGGNIGVFSHYDEFGKWHGFHEYFPIRWKPQLNKDLEGSFANASILHPLKEYMHPIRVEHREKREKWKVLNKKVSLLA